jgi:hypothetical protein
MMERLMKMTPMFRNEIAGENVIRLANGFPINTFYGRC